MISPPKRFRTVPGDVHCGRREVAGVRRPQVGRRGGLRPWRRARDGPADRRTPSPEGGVRAGAGPEVHWTARLARAPLGATSARSRLPVDPSRRTPPAPAGRPGGHRSRRRRAVSVWGCGRPPGHSSDRLGRPVLDRIAAALEVTRVGTGGGSGETACSRPGGVLIPYRWGGFSSTGRKSRSRLPWA